MCGISGIYSLNGAPVAEAEVAAQIETIVHRGPNQGGCFIAPGGRCGLGIRRLSIIDVAGGQQPLHNEDGRIHLVYNGESYNHETLRRELEQRGHRPHSHSDAEVVLHGYEEWGPAGVLQRLRGMAAFALWDEPRRRLLLARDRFGIKPLYYAAHAGRLRFGSEIKTILADPTFPRRVNLAGLEAMLTLGFVPGPATMFEGVFKLPPAHFLLAQAGRIEIEPYWQLDYQPHPAPLSEAAAAEQFLALLEEAVNLRLMSEVPLGALLSGGLDSGTLVALVQAGLDRAAIRREWQAMVGGERNQLRTISLGFEAPGYDEAPLAAELAGYIGTEHHPLTFGPADFADYPTVMRHLEEPQASATALPIYKLYQACRAAGLTVVLTGEGADELLGGYHWHQGEARLRSLRSLRLLSWPAPLRRLLAASPLPLSAAARRVLERGAVEVPTRYRDWLEVGGADFRARLLSAEARAGLGHNGANPLLADWAGHLSHLAPDTPVLHQMLWLESRSRMVDFINFEVDKLSMAHAIEARVPFLDHKLWEFCAGLPPGFKLKGGVEKHLLRQATRDLLPPATRRRRKKGLAAPYSRWLQAERLPDWAESALSPAALSQAGLFDPAAVLALRRVHQAGQPQLGALLMGVLSTQVWLDVFGV